MSQRPGCATQLVAPTLVVCSMKARIKGQAMLSPFWHTTATAMNHVSRLHTCIPTVLFVCLSFCFFLSTFDIRMPIWHSLTCTYLVNGVNARAGFSLLARPNVDRKESVLTQGITLVKLKRLSWRWYYARLNWQLPFYRFEVFLGSQAR